MLCKGHKIQTDVNFHFRALSQHLREELCFVSVLCSPSVALQGLTQLSGERLLQVGGGARIRIKDFQGWCFVP